MRQVSNIYKALSDQSRVRILFMLKEKPLCVCEMVDILKLANSTVSKHLSILRNTNLIIDQKDGRWVNYRLATSTESEHINTILPQLDNWLTDDVTIKQDREAVKAVDRTIICASD
jgi:ArsR family transcriptional regulator